MLRALRNVWMPYVFVAALAPTLSSADDYSACVNEIDADIGIQACETALTEALTVDERAEVYLSLGLHQRKSGNYDAALGHLGEASSLTIDNSAAMTEIGLVHQLRGNYSDAVAAYTEALLSEPDAIRALNNRAIALLALGNLKDAIADFDHALSIDSGDGDIWNNRANAHCKLGKVDQAYADRVRALYQGRFTAAAAQRGLRKSGYYNGPSDGIWGPDSEDALLEWTKGGCPDAPKTRLN